jgi:hypothetical protein
MVKLVRSVGLGAVIAAASTGLIHADPIDSIYTATGVNAPIDKCFPGSGRAMAKTCEANVVVKASETPARRLRHLEDAANSDVGDLESYFGESMELDFTTLKEQYASAAAPSTPWPGSYWPTYQDSINVIWKSGEKSASEKYAKAYGLDPTDFKDKVSANNGIDSRSSSTQCTADTDCTSRNDGSVCSKRKGATSGYCIPTWYGICHAWSPAALLEEEPQCDVVKNGQTFHVMDIKALMTDLYDGAGITTVFTGARFNGPDTPVSLDSYGRYQSATRRDLGAGFFHIAIANILGKHKQSFVADVTAGSQVWNQPVRSYSVQTMELVDTAQASQQYFGTSTYPFNSDMVHLAYVKTTLSWIVEAYADGPLVSTGVVDAYTVSNDYEYLLELDASNVVIGGEWVGDSKTDHPDFLWFPTAKPDASTVTSTGLSYANVKELLELSVSCSASGSASASASAGMSEAASTSASAETSTSASASASAGTSEAASAGTSTSASAETSASASESASAGTSEAASVSASASASASTSSTASTSGSTSSGSAGSEASTSTSSSGTNEDASVASSGSTTSSASSYEARSASEDGSAAGTPGGKDESTGSSTGSTTDATDTYSSRSSADATEDTAASLPSGKDALILTPSTTAPSASATDAPIDTGYYTPPPTTGSQDLADVIETIDTTDASGSSAQETVTDAPSSSEAESLTPVHNSCH